MKWLRRLWYRFLRAPQVFIAARPHTVNPTVWDVGGGFDWFVYADGEWMGPYTHPEAHDVANRLEIAFGVVRDVECNQ